MRLTNGDLKPQFLLRYREIVGNIHYFRIPPWTSPFPRPMRIAIFRSSLRGVREDHATYVVTSHGKPVAKIVPVDAEVEHLGSGAWFCWRASRTQPALNAGRWTRDELYERDKCGSRSTPTFLPMPKAINDDARRDARDHRSWRVPQLTVSARAGARRTLHECWSARAAAAQQARERCSAGAISFSLIDTSQPSCSPRWILPRHQFSIWDAIILAAAAQGDCRLLLSEDMQRRFHLERRHHRQSVFQDAASAARSDARRRRPLERRK